MDEEITMVSVDTSIKVFLDDPTASPKKRSLDDDNESDSEGDTHPARFKRQNTGAYKQLEKKQSPSPISSDLISSSNNTYSTGNSPNHPSSSPHLHASDNSHFNNLPSVKSNPSSYTHIAMRSLVSTKDAGIIIGKGGSSVAEIREISGAKITVSEMMAGATERVLTATGSPETIAKAYGLISGRLIQESSSDDKKPLPVPVRLLVTHMRMGSVIGKQGSKIKDIQAVSGARVQASEHLLPMSSERTITVTGSPDQIESAVLQIAKILKDSISARGAGSGMLYKPMPMQPMYGGNMYPPMESHYYDHHPANKGFSPSRGMAHYPPHPFPNYPGPAVPMHPTYPGVGLSPGKLQSQQIYIPNDMVGSIIGKGGSKINEVRQMSGAHIKIADNFTENGERLITISGTPEANQAALYLLYNRLEAEKNRLRKGKGLGKDSKGITKAVSVARKNNTDGLGKGADTWNDAWWDKMYSQTAKTITVATEPNGVVTVSKNEVVIESKSHTVSSPSPSPTGLYSFFVKTSSSMSQNDIQGTRKEEPLDDVAVLAACGGVVLRTGARGGSQEGKLKRIQEQDSLFQKKVITLSSLKTTTEVDKEIQVKKKVKKEKKKEKKQKKSTSKKDIENVEEKTKSKKSKKRKSSSDDTTKPSKKKKSKKESYH